MLQLISFSKPSIEQGQCQSLTQKFVRWIILIFMNLPWSAQFAFWAGFLKVGNIYKLSRISAV
jgi:hypothetical protein